MAAQIASDERSGTPATDPEPEVPAPVAQICAPHWWDRVALRGAITAPYMPRGSDHGAGHRGPVLVVGTTRAPVAAVRPGEFVVAGAVAPLLSGAVSRLGGHAHVGALTLPAHEGWQTAGLHVVSAVLGDPAQVARALRAVAPPVIEQWTAAVGEREVWLASPRSFCAGVERAVLIVERALVRFGAPVYVRRQIVHNTHVVARLQDLGAIFVDELEAVPAGATVVLAAHGVSPQVRRDADRRRLRVIDATCPLVAKVHAEVRRFANQDHTVFLIGHDDHEEVIGTRGEAPGNVIVVEDPAQAAEVTAPDPNKVAYVMQTTLAHDEAQRTAAVLRERFPALTGPGADDICYATTNRQSAVAQIARRSERVLVVGSQNSSNSKRLAEVAERQGTPAYLIEDVGAIDLRWLVGVRRVGITAGASAPPHLVEQVIRALAGLGRVAVHDSSGDAEDVRFTLPSAVD